MNIRVQRAVFLTNCVYTGFFKSSTREVVEPKASKRQLIEKNFSLQSAHPECNLSFFSVKKFGNRHQISIQRLQEHKEIIQMLKTRKHFENRSYEQMFN